MTQHRTARLRGFVMIEVLVSLVLVTSVGVAIVMWAENGLHSIVRLREEYERTRAIRLVQDWIRAQPENTSNTGEKTIGDLKIKWERRLLNRLAQSGYPHGFGAHDAMLFEFQYVVFRTAQDTQPWFEDSATVVKSKIVRSAKSPL